MTPARSARFEAGQYDPSLMLAFAIAKLFELRIEDVFYPDK